MRKVYNLEVMPANKTISFTKRDDIQPSELLGYIASVLFELKSDLEFDITIKVRNG